MYNEDSYAILTETIKTSLMYNGKVQVNQEELNMALDIARSLKPKYGVAIVGTSTDYPTLKLVN